MSREILAFGVFAGAAFVATALCWIFPGAPLAQAGLACAAAVGLLAVFTSVMIYADTRRAFWALKLTAPRFYGATVLLGLTTVAAGMSWLEFFGATNLDSAFRIATAFGVAAHALLIGSEIRDAVQALRESSLIKRSERTIRMFLPWLRPARIVLFVLAACSSAIALMTSGAGSTAGMTVALAATFASQVLERFSFFTAVTAPRMPGGV